MPKEGILRIQLLKPTASSQSSVGDVIPGTPVEYEVFADRFDRGGRVTEQASELTGQWTTRWECSIYPDISGIDTTWQLKDDNGRTADIESVIEISSPAVGNRRVAVLAAGV